MQKLLLITIIYWLFSIPVIAQWVSTQGPYGGNVYQMLANDTYLYATKSSGLYRSADLGLNWEICDATNLFGRIAIDGSNLLGSYIDNDQALLRFTSDNGDHWQNIPLPGQLPFLDNVAVKGNILLFTHLNQIWWTEDLGSSWGNVQIIGESFHNYKLLGTFEGRLYLGNRTRLFSASDGANWTYLSTVPGNSNNHITKIFRKDDVMISVSGGTVARSLDGGQQWQIGAVEGNLTLGANTAITRENGIYYASSGIPMVQSMDNGLSWTIINPDGPKLYYHTSKDNILLGHLFGLGVFRSTDGGQTFLASNQGLSNGDVMTLGLQNNDLWVWDEWGISKQNTAQFNWAAPPTLPSPTYFGAFVTVLGFKNAILARKDHGDLLRSMDDGQNWSTITPDASIVSSDFIKFKQKNDSLFLSGESYQTYLSTDLGEHWEIINPHINSQINGTMQDMAVQGDHFFVTDNTSIYRSKDGMQTWDLVGVGKPFGVNAASIRLFSTPQLLFAFVNKTEVYRSDNQGETWSLVSLPFPSVFNISEENEISFHQIEEAVVGFFELGGIFVSYDDGLSWATFNDGIPYQESTTSFVFNETNMWVGTYDFGVFQRKTSDLMALSVAQPNRNQDKLEISPNPSQGIFNLKIPVEISGTANLQVFNLQGQQMLHRTESAEHLSTIDLSQCPKGVYWVSLTTAQGVFGGTVLLQ